MVKRRHKAIRFRDQHNRLSSGVIKGGVKTACTSLPGSPLMQALMRTNAAYCVWAWCPPRGDEQERIGAVLSRLSRAYHKDRKQRDKPRVSSYGANKSLALREIWRRRLRLRPDRHIDGRRHSRSSFPSPPSSRCARLEISRARRR
jgi:hypothetical protein